MMKKIFSFCGIFFLATLLLFPQINVAAQKTALGKLKNEYPAIMREYGQRLANQKADYVIAIDVSGSMIKHQDVVTSAMGNFINSIPEGDHVTIIRFGSKVEKVGLDNDINKDNRDYFVEQLTKAYTEANGHITNATNLYSMCDEVCEILKRPGHNDLQYVFMFTDFLQSGSSPNWENLKSKSASLYKAGALRVFAMQLPGNHEDLPNVRKVFPNLQAVDASQYSQLNSWFENQKSDIYLTRLRDMIIGDKDVWAIGNHVDLKMRLRTNKKVQIAVKMDDKVPHFVRAIKVDKCELIKYEKVASVKLDTLVKSILRGEKANVGYIKYKDIKAPWATGSKITIKVPCHLVFQSGDKEGEESFQDEIIKLGIQDQLVMTKELSAKNNFVFIWAVWLLCICAGLLAVWVYLLFVNTLKPHKLGYLTLNIEGDRSYELPNKRIVKVGAQNCDITVTGMTSPLLLKGKSGSPLMLIRRRVKAMCKANNSTDRLTIGGKFMKGNAYHTLKLQTMAAITGVSVYNFNLVYTNMKKTRKANPFICIGLFSVCAIAVLLVAIFL